MSAPHRSLSAALCASFALSACDHEPEWRSRTRFAPSQSAIAGQLPPVAAALPEPPCADTELLQRWQSAARPGRLCELLPRVSANYFATLRMPSFGIPSSIRATMRGIVEKCRAEIRFAGRIQNFYSLNSFYLLITPSGAMVLGTPMVSLPGNPFHTCVLRWIPSHSSLQADGDLLEVTVPPLGMRWWPDTQTPWLTQGQVW